MAKNNNMRLLFIAAVVGVIIYLLSSGRVLSNDGVLGNDLSGSMLRGADGGKPNYLDSQKLGALDGQSVPSSLNEQQTKIMTGLNEGECYPRAQLSASELLPKDSIDEWSASNPGGVGSLCDKNFLTSGAMIGISSVGQTLRNPNLQIRSEPIIPQQIVSPWLQSTIAPDLVRRPLELGTAPLSCSDAEWAK